METAQTLKIDGWMTYGIMQCSVYRLKRKEKEKKRKIDSLSEGKCIRDHQTVMSHLILSLNQDKSNELILLQLQRVSQNIKLYDAMMLFTIGLFVGRQYALMCTQKNSFTVNCYQWY